MRKTIKGLPIAAVLLVAVIFGGKAMMKESKVLTDGNWVYNPALTSGCDTTKPECYELYSGTDFSEVCEFDEEVCGIVAPVQMIAGQQRPIIDATLKALIQANQHVAGKIYLGPAIAPSK